LTLGLVKLYKPFLHKIPEERNLEEELREDTGYDSWAILADKGYCGAEGHLRAIFK